jgi:hypothetical protein
MRVRVCLIFDCASLIDCTSHRSEAFICGEVLKSVLELPYLRTIHNAHVGLGHWRSLPVAVIAAPISALAVVILILGCRVVHCSGNAVPVGRTNGEDPEFLSAARVPAQDVYPRGNHELF